MPVLRNGDDSPWVASAQRALQQRGLYAKTIDGDFGHGTENAVRAFQLSLHLPVTGQVDEETARALGLDDLIGAVLTSSPESVALLFPGTRFENVEANLPFVVKGLVADGLRDKSMFLMALATIRAETQMFLPISARTGPAAPTPAPRRSEERAIGVEVTRNQSAGNRCGLRGARASSALTGRRPTSRLPSSRRRRSTTSWPL